MYQNRYGMYGVFLLRVFRYWGEGCVEIETWKCCLQIIELNHTVEWLDRIKCSRFFWGASIILIGI